MRNGIGALSFTFIDAQEAKEWVDSYYRIIASEECVPVGRAVNPNFSVVLPFMCHRDPEIALDRGLDGAYFFAYSFFHYYVMGQHQPGITDLATESEQMGPMFGFVRNLDPAVTAEMDPKMVEWVGSLRRGIGSPEQLTDVIRS